MKYILPILLISLFIGCNKNTTQNNENNITKINLESNNTKNLQHNSANIITIKENDFNLSFKNNKLIYPDKKMVILFYDNNFYSQEEERILNRLNVKFYKTKNQFLINYFNITYFPTIVVLDKNKTIKFENFTPYEILKTEGF